MAERETELAFLKKSVENPITAQWSQTGWGYVVLAAAFVAAFLLDGVESSFGVLMPHLVTELGADVALTSFSGGLITGTALSIGPIVSRLIETFGCRLVAFAGGVICCVSIVLSTLSVNIAMFVIFYGVCSGIGVGMAYMSYITVVNIYFDKRRSFAMGLVTSGSGFGLLSMALLINFLISSYGWRGSYLIVAAIWGHLCAIALIMRPLNSSDVAQEKDSSDTIEICHHHSLDVDKASVSAQTPDTQQNSHGLFSSTLNDTASCVDSIKQGRTSPTIWEESLVSHDGKSNCFPATQDHQDHNHAHDCIAPLNILPSVSMYSLEKTSQDQLEKDLQIAPQLLEVGSFHEHPSPTKTLVRNDFVNLPSECISSSLISLTSITSRRSQDLQSLPHHGLPKSEKGQGQTAVARQTQGKATYASLLKNPVFLLFCFGAFSFQLAFNIGPMFAPSYALDLGLTADQASFTVSVIGICNMIGRFLTGLLSYLGIGNLRVYIVGTFLAGFICFFISLCDTYVSLILFAACYGLFLGVFFPLQSVILVDILGIDQLPKSFGIICFCKSFACMLGPYLAGALYDMTQDYTVPFLFAGGVNVFASFTQFIMARLRQPCCELWKS